MGGGASSRWHATWCWPPSASTPRPAGGLGRARPGFGILRRRLVSGGTRPSSWCWPGADQRRGPAISAWSSRSCPARARAGRAAARREDSRAGAVWRSRGTQRMVNRGRDRGRPATASRRSPCVPHRDAAEGIRALTERREHRVRGALGAGSVCRAHAPEYCIGIPQPGTNLSVCEDIMVPGTAAMGSTTWPGETSLQARDAPVTAQFPRAVHDVNEIICSVTGTCASQSQGPRPGPTRPPGLGRVACNGGTGERLLEKLPSSRNTSPAGASLGR